MRAFLFVFAILLAVASGTTRTVGTGGTYATIQLAINAAVAGDVISIIEAKTYTEQLTLVNNGTAPSRITMRNDSGGAVTVANATSPVVELAGKDYWTFTSAITFKYTGVGTAPRVFNNTHGTEIDSPILNGITASIEGGSADGCVIYIADADAMTITGCTIQVTDAATESHDGVNALFSSNLTFTNNTVTGATTKMQDGIVATGTNLTITGNTLSNGQDLPAHPDGIVIQGDGDRALNPTANVVIANNLVSDFDQCIYLDAISANMSGILIYNNLIRQTAGYTAAASITGFNIDGDGPGTLKIECEVSNNTIDVRGIWGRNGRCSQASSVANTKLIRNNLAVNPGYTGLYLDQVDYVTLNYNLYDSAGDATVTNYAGVAKTFAQLQAVPQEANGLRAAPGLVSSTNYRAASISSAIVNVGATISSVSTDLLGVSRPQGIAYDIGAYEFPIAAAATVGKLGGGGVTPGTSLGNFGVVPSGN